jgi:two-component system NarL family sensor kinase
VLYGTAREALTNVVKHARAQNVWVDLDFAGDRATLRIADDGVGVSEARLAKSLEEGHIGMASTRTKVLAAEGLFDIRATSPGTEITVCVPVAPTEIGSATEELAAL